MNKQQWLNTALSKLMGKVSRYHAPAIPIIKSKATDYLSHTWDEMGAAKVEFQDHINPSDELSTHSSGDIIFKDAQSALLAKKKPDLKVIVFILIINLMLFCNSIVEIPMSNTTFIRDVQAQSIYLDTTSPRGPAITLYNSEPASDTYSNWTAVSGAYVEQTLGDLLSGS